MQLTDFIAGHLEQAGQIAFKLWSDEVPDMPLEIRQIIYHYLPRYYFDPRSPFNLAAVKNGSLQGLLLASSDLHEPVEANDWLNKHLPASGFAYGQTYQAYLDGNRHLEERFKGSKDIQLLFFASIQRGCGRLLMEEFVRRSHAAGYENMLLWTDNTCNFQYYFDHGFDLLYRNEAEPGIPGMQLETMLFRRRLI